MSFPKNVEERALVACGRCCCICHKFCGTKIELHHIKQRAYGGEDTFENCIPLCFDCHADMGKADPKHARGKHYSESELKQHRDNWYKQASNSTHIIDSKATSNMDTSSNKESSNYNGKIERTLKETVVKMAIEKRLKDRF